MSKSKKILIISFFFPPSGAIGAVRITKFVKYLLRFNWDVTVVTVNEKYYKTFNHGALQDVIGAKIIRTEIIKPIKGLNEWGLYWLPYLNRELKKLLDREKFDISFWTGNPFYQWILAPKFKKMCNLTYVLDFRDGWSLQNIVRKWECSVFYKMKRFLDVKLAEKLEPKIIKEADAIINVTDELTELYKFSYKHLVSQDLFFTIYNGFDLEDIPKGELNKISKFEIIYAGKFGKFLNPIPFFKAFKQFIIEKNLKPQDLIFTWIGDRDKKILNFLDELHIQDYLNLVDFKPYKEALSMINRANLALLLVSHSSEGSTKIFDYIALGKTILVISDNEARAVKIAREYGKSKIVKNEQQAIKEALNEIYSDKFSGTVNKEILNFYNREFQTKQLEYILNSIIEKRGI